MFLRDIEVGKRYSAARATVWSWLKNDPTFPKPVKLSGGATRWRISDLEQWEDSRGEGDRRVIKRQPKRAAA